MTIKQNKKKKSKITAKWLPIHLHHDCGHCRWHKMYTILECMRLTTTHALKCVSVECILNLGFGDKGTSLKLMILNVGLANDRYIHMRKNIKMRDVTVGSNIINSKWNPSFFCVFPISRHNRFSSNESNFFYERKWISIRVIWNPLPLVVMQNIHAAYQ